VAKRVRIEGDDRRDILLLCMNVRCRDVSSSCLLSSRRVAFRRKVLELDVAVCD
jgi:hypothetical protein